MKKLIILIIKFYRKYISPVKRTKCPYYPTCSEYGLEAVEKYGDRRETQTKINDVKNLMENMKWTVEQALDALSIKGKERTMIIGKLQK